MSNAPIFSPSKLTELREGAGLSRPALAAEMGRSENSIWNWENGTTGPRLDQLGHLAEVLGCSISDLFSPANADDPPDKGGPSKNGSGRIRNASA